MINEEANQGALKDILISLAFLCLTTFYIHHNGIPVCAEYIQRNSALM